MSESVPTHSPSVASSSRPPHQNRHPADVGFSFRAELRPHEGYRRYFDPAGMSPSEIPHLFSGNDLTANFPSVRYAAGWAYADHAIDPRPQSLDVRESLIAAAEAEWQEAIRLTSVTYELLPGRFLLWPCTKWRYKFAVDTVPTLHAIAQAHESTTTTYSETLLEQSRQNVNATVQNLIGKYAWMLSHYTDEAAGEISFDQLSGRLGAIMGVAIEGAALSAAQLAGNEHAVLPPSLRHDYAGSTAVDLIAHTTRHMTFSAQVKQRVRSHDRKKYQDVALVCAAHHMKQPHQSLYDTLHMIASDSDQAASRHIGRIILKVMQGNQFHGCSASNPRPLHARFHRSRVGTNTQNAA